MNKIGWGLIGCGDIARKRIAPALRDLENCEFIGVSRRQGELAKSFAQEFGAQRHYSAWEDLVADEAIQAVYIATPVELHAAQAIAAAEAGKHVLCEKPMSMNVAECDRMMAAASENRVKLGVAYYRHFYPVVRRIKELIASGEIGQPVIAQINAFEFFNPAPDHPRSWLLRKNRSGGGPMFDFGCHRIEVLTNIFGPIAKVRAQVANVAFEREVEDSATALFQFAKGTCATLAVSHAAREPQDTLDIFGTQGSIHVSNLNEGVMRVVCGTEERCETHSPHPNLHLPLIEDFVDAVINDREPLVNHEAGRTVAMIEEKIYANSHSHLASAR
jgi:predicted dehydrogenase